MKPIKLSHAFLYEPFDPSISPSWIKSCLDNFDTESDQRDVFQNCESSTADPLFTQLQNFLLTRSFTLRHVPDEYFSCSFGFISGCVAEHSDPGYGLCAATLLYKNKREGYDDSSQLLTRHGGLDLHINDVFVFNANKWHAWLCNVDCLLAMMTVKKIRSKKLKTDSIIQP